MTWIDLVKQYFPDANDAECDFILWEFTAFPFAKVDYIKEQLRQYKLEVKK